MLLLPDRLNGRTIYRGVSQVSGVNHQNDAILFPPKLVHGQTPVKPFAELDGEIQGKLVVIGEKTDAITTKLLTQVRKLLTHAMKRAVLNERERIRLALEKHGLKEAQHAMMDGADG